MRICTKREYSEASYEHAIEIFLTHHPNGEIRQDKRRLDGADYPEQRKRTKSNLLNQKDAIENVINEGESEGSKSLVNLEDISSDEWTDSDDEK